MEKRKVENQRTNGPVNAHLISGPRIRTKYYKTWKKQGKEMTLTVTFNTHLLSFTKLVSLHLQIFRPLVAIVF